MPKRQIEFSDHFCAVASLPFGGMVWWYLSDTRDANLRSGINMWWCRKSVTTSRISSICALPMCLHQVIDTLFKEFCILINSLYLS
jgi:hypothetical protein